MSESRPTDPTSVPLRQVTIETLAARELDGVDGWWQRVVAVSALQALHDYAKQVRRFYSRIMFVNV